MSDYIYTRVSTSRQTVLNQVVALQKEYPNAIIVREVGSAYRGKLPVLDKLIGLTMRKGDRLIIWSIDRLGRRIAELTQLFDLFNKKGYVLISKRESIDLSTPNGRLIGHIFAALAQVESEIRSERIRMGLLRARKAGKVLGRPIGFKLKEEQMRRRKPESDHVNGFTGQVMTLRRQGLSYAKIAQVMNERDDVKVSKATIGRYVKRYETDPCFGGSGEPHTGPPS